MKIFLHKTLYSLTGICIGLFVAITALVILDAFISWRGKRVDYDLVAILLFLFFSIGGVVLGYRYGKNRIGTQGVHLLKAFAVFFLTLALSIGGFYLLITYFFPEPTICNFSASPTLLKDCVQPSLATSSSNAESATALAEIPTLPVGTYRLVAEVQENSLVCGRSRPGVSERCLEVGELILKDGKGTTLSVRSRLSMGRVNELKQGRRYSFSIEKDVRSDGPLYFVSDFQSI